MTGCVLVTGGTGYLGRPLVRALLGRQRPVRVLARPGSDVSGLEGAEIVRGDVTNAADLGAALRGAERVFHLAAETRDGQPREVYRKVNFDAVVSLLDLAREHGVRRVVHTSSYLALGRTGPPRMPPDHVADEYWTHDPDDMAGPHEESKYDAEHAVNQCVSRKEPVLALLPTMVYGPEARPVRRVEDLSSGNRIVALLAQHAAGGLPRLPGTGEQLWNLVHVDDVVAGHLAAMDAEDAPGWPPDRWGHWHFILGGENVKVADLFARFARLSGVAAPPVGGPKGGLFKRLFGGGAAGGARSAEREALDAGAWAYSSAMAGKDFGYAGRRLDEGLPGTVDWMRAQGLIGAGR